MTKQKTDQTRREPNVEERETTKRAFVEPEISGPVDVLEATAFFQVGGSGGTEVTPDLGE